MNVLGHAGLTLGVVYSAGYLVDLLTPQVERNPHHGRRSIRSLLWFWKSWPKSVERLKIDFRLVLIGSLLPDIIDKPLGLWLRPEFVNVNLRTVGHSLTFNLALLAIAILLLISIRARRPLILAFSSAGHLLFDQMWRQPDQLLWPAYGWVFPRGTTSLDEWFRFQFSGRWFGPEELLGAAFLIWFAVHLYQNRALWRFLKLGGLSGTG